ncbi:hypothetical protein [Microbacterium candidum]|uniref:Uncharacterized protein n=1 Tax=Microbacterium candidum TaxID=3041922 RepID=A0ABT7MVR0_9MICO|nr:hypothetical protein [Microbacterium sp. ASV49]MDL9978534.1 hypothetical protein [Microbacterium sp. ASV49]
MRMRMLLLIAASVLLLVGTVLVFVAFDAHSHSASDTIRPFVITIVPIWAAFSLAVWAGSAGARRRDRE